MHHKLVESNIGWKALALQCNILFYLFASSGLALPKVLMKCLFDYFWKPISPFSKFCVNCLLRLYFVYCNICVLNVVHRACYCTCSLMTVRVPEMCFWPAQTKKKLELFEVLTCLWPGAQILFRLKWRKLATASLSFLCIDGYICPGYWIEFL